MSRKETSPTKRRQRKPESPDALTVSVERAAELLGLSRNCAYEQVAAGKIPALRFGRSIRIPKAAVTRMVEAAAAEPAGS